MCMKSEAGGPVTKHCQKNSDCEGFPLCVCGCKCVNKICQYCTESSFLDKIDAHLPTNWVIGLHMQLPRIRMRTIKYCNCNKKL